MQASMLFRRMRTMAQPDQDSFRRVDLAELVEKSAALAPVRSPGVDFSANAPSAAQPPFACLKIGTCPPPF